MPKLIKIKWTHTKGSQVHHFPTERLNESHNPLHQLLRFGEGWQGSCHVIGCEHDVDGNAEQQGEDWSCDTLPIIKFKSVTSLQPHIFTSEIGNFMPPSISFTYFHINTKYDKYTIQLLNHLKIYCNEAKTNYTLMNS